MHVIFAIALAVALSLNSSWGSAADIREQDVAQSDGAKIITVTGELELGDERRFSNIAVQAKGAVVLFDSPGGSVPAAIQIGKAIRLEGFATVVPEGSTCASACALAWLGGVARYMGASAKVGFHAAYVSASGERQVSSVANALIGGYLNGLGFSENAIAFFTSAPPEGVRWLTFEESTRLGIEVRSIDEKPKEEGGTSPRSTPNTEQTPMTNTMRAKVFARIFVAAGESNNPEDLLKYYRQKVLYFGRVKDKSEIAAEYETYLRRWPYRRFAAPDEEISVACDDISQRCRISMGIRWLAESSERRQRSEGTARRSMILQASGDAFSVLALEESILSRNVTALGSVSSQQHRMVFRVASDVSEGILNMRNGPGRRHEVVTSIPAGSDNVQQVGSCVESDDGASRHRWCNVEWNGRVGWVSSSGLRSSR